LISKFMAKMAYGIRTINPENPQTEDERWLVNTVSQLAHDAQIPLPEIGIYQSPEVNAFATGPSKGSSIVAVSSSLLSQMNRRETQGVLAHEITHIANGDMVTMTLLQGVLNTFVIFLSRVLGFAIDSALSKRDDDSRGGFGIGYFLGTIICQIILSILATMIVMWFSRHREFRADAGAAMLCGKQPMIEGLEKLKTIVETRNIVDDRSQALNTFKISGKSSFLALFSSHPPLEKRIEALKKM